MKLLFAIVPATAALVAAGLMVSNGSAEPDPAIVNSPGRPAVFHESPRGMAAAIRLTGERNDVSIGPRDLSGAYRAIDTAKAASIRNLVLHDITALDLQRGGIRLRGNVEGATIRNFRLQMRGQPQVPPNLPEGIAIQSGDGITISDGTVSGFRMASIAGRYTNGDGISAERKVTGLVIRRVVSSDNSDGGFDLKSGDVQLDDLRSERNFRNYRLWGNIRAGTLASVDPRGAHVWLGGGASVHIRRLVARSGSPSPLIEVEQARELIVDSCDLHLPPGTPIVTGNTAGVRVSLGPSCKD